MKSCSAPSGRRSSLMVCFDLREFRIICPVPPKNATSGSGVLRLKGYRRRRTVLLRRFGAESPQACVSAAHAEPGR